MDIDIEQYRNLIWSIVNRFRPDDEDLFQEGLIALWYAAQRYDPTRGSLFTTYAYKWIWNRIRTAARRYRRVELELVEWDEPEETDLDRSLMVEYIKDKMAVLSPSTRRLIELWLDGYAPCEIACMENLSRANVRSRIAWAFKKLRNLAQDDQLAITYQEYSEEENRVGSEKQ